MLKRIALFAVLAVGFIACEPSEAGHTELGALPQADYTMTYIDSNNVQFTSNSTGDPFLFSWEIEGVGTYTGETVDVFIGSIGVYNVKHTVFNQGGSATATGTVEIFKEGPPPCVGAIEWLTECDERTWKLAPQAGSLWVGSTDGATWWAVDANGATNGRPCTYNDEWTFTADGDMVYNANGDFWGEPIFGFSPEGCYNENMLTGTLEGWKSGTHGYQVIPANNDHPDQIKVVGTGAFLGLHKVANGAEVSTPQTEITYDILSMTDVAGDRYMEIEVNFGPGLWRFTLYSES
jgi:hypothetical protein